MKSIIQSSLIVLLLSLIPFSVSAQGNFFDKGESGSSLILGYTEVDDATVTQGSFVATTKGLLDFGISLGSIDPVGFGDNLRIFGLHLELFPLRESTKSGIPINISIFGIWTNHDPDNSNSYVLGGSLFKKLDLGERAYFVPTFRLTKVWPFGFDNDVVNFTDIEFPLVMKISSSFRVSFTGSFSSNDELGGTGMFIGLTFMSKTKNER